MDFLSKLYKPSIWATNSCEKCGKDTVCPIKPILCLDCELGLSELDELIKESQGESLFHQMENDNDQRDGPRVR